MLARSEIIKNAIKSLYLQRFQGNREIVQLSANTIVGMLKLKQSDELSNSIPGLRETVIESLRNNGEDVSKLTSIEIHENSLQAIIEVHLMACLLAKCSPYFYALRTPQQINELKNNDVLELDFLRLFSSSLFPSILAFTPEQILALKGYIDKYESVVLTIRTTLTQFEPHHGQLLTNLLAGKKLTLDYRFLHHLEESAQIMFQDNFLSNIKKLSIKCEPLNQIIHARQNLITFFLVKFAHMEHVDLSGLGFDRCDANVWNLLCESFLKNRITWINPIRDLPLDRQAQLDCIIKANIQRTSLKDSVLHLIWQQRARFENQIPKLPIELRDLFSEEGRFPIPTKK